MDRTLQKRIDLERYWNEIPVGVENAVDYSTLCDLWKKKKREVRRILQELSRGDNGDDFVLVRSGHGKGFYKTDNAETLIAYKRECLNKGRAIFAPVRKINRILDYCEGAQLNAFNNLKAVRLAKNIKQTEVCEYMKKYDETFDPPLLSKMENSVCLPTPYQLRKLADFYGVKPTELIAVDLYTVDICGAI